MGEDAVNDDSVEANIWTRQPDPFGQAAILLIESLIHGLVARSVLSVPEAVEIVEVAADVKSDIGAEIGESRSTLRKSLALLDSIGESLKQDI